MSIWNKMGTAQAGGKLPKLDKDGLYKCAVHAVKLADSFKGGGKSFVIEFLVQESDNELIKKGQLRSVTINKLFSNKDYEQNQALYDVRHFLAAIYTNALEVEIDPDAEQPSEGQEWPELVDQTLDMDGESVKGSEFWVRIVNDVSSGGFKFQKKFFAAKRSTLAAERSEVA